MVITVVSSQVLAGGQPWEMPKEETASSVLRFRLTNTVFAHIKDYYIDFYNLVATEVLRDALRGIEDIVPNLKVDVREEAFFVRLGSSTKTFNTTGIKSWLVLRELLKEIITFIESGASCPVTTPELEYVALNGILNSFDPYSRLYRPEDLERIRTLSSGSFVGLGMEVEFKEGFLTVVDLYKDSPAYKAGLQIGDRIVEIEGESTKNMGLSEALSRMSGPRDTDVTLSVYRSQGHSSQEDGQILSFTLKRERIELEPAEWSLLEEGLGYIKLRGFQEGAFYSMVKAVRGLEEAGGLRGLVLDLRNNYGGVMEEIIKVAELFLPSGIITVKTRTGEKLPEFVTAHPSGRIEETCPIVVLVDEGSASGAEILAVTLKDNGRALLVGKQTFGKACIQQVFRLHGRYTLKLTTAKYFTPRGEYINLKGLTPDVLLVPIKVERDKTTLTRQTHYAHGNRESQSDSSSPTVLCYLEKGESTADGFQKDFHVQLARAFLKATLSEGKGSHRVGKLEAIFAQKVGEPDTIGSFSDALWQIYPKVVKEYQKEEDRKIVKALESRKIDWSAGQAEGIPVSVASLIIDKEEVEAGDTITLTLSVENRGEYPLFRVLAKSVSGNPTFDGLEFLLGKVEPGKKVSHSIKVKIPDDSLDRQDEIVFRFTEDNGFPPTDIMSNVIVWAHPTPLFAYSYHMTRIQTGQETAVSLRVKNVGNGVSRKSIVVLKGDEEAGIRVQKGRQEPGVLKPGEEREVKLTFTSLMPDVATTQTDTARAIAPTGGGKATSIYKKEVSPLRIFVTDPLLGTQLSARLPLQEGEAEVFCLPPSIILQNAVLVAMKGFVELSFTARDDHYLKGAYIMVNKHKVFFDYNPEPTPEHTFTANLPIIKGPNLIQIVAYDDQGLSSEKAFVLTGK